MKVFFEFYFNKTTNISNSHFPIVTFTNQVISKLTSVFFILQKKYFIELNLH